jgi:general secretion pathway protein K
LPFPAKYPTRAEEDEIAVTTRLLRVTNRLTVPSIRFSGAGSPLRGLWPYRARSNREGFALVAVIWSLGLITLLGMAVMIGARYRTRVASSYASVVAAEAAAESAINLGIATALTGVAEQNVRFPLRCRMPGGERVLITVEEETGKIDLNTASPAVLARFFTALTRDQSLGARIAERVTELRHPNTKDGNTGPAYAPPGPGFTTIMQLDQVDGISPRLFRSALRLVTVRSGRPEPDMDAAPPALRRLLNLEQKPLSPARGLPAGGSVTIRADVRSSDGTRFIREALVSLAEGGRPFLIREWRHGDIDATALTPLAPRDDTQAEGSCLRAVGAVAS